MVNEKGFRLHLFKMGVKWVLALGALIMMLLLVVVVVVVVAMSQVVVIVGPDDGDDDPLLLVVVVVVGVAGEGRAVAEPPVTGLVFQVLLHLVEILKNKEELHYAQRFKGEHNIRRHLQTKLFVSSFESRERRRSHLRSAAAHVCVCVRGRARDGEKKASIAEKVSLTPSLVTFFLPAEEACLSRQVEEIAFLSPTLLYPTVVLLRKKDEWSNTSRTSFFPYRVIMSKI